MIANRRATSSVHDWVIDQGIELFTTPMANPDPHDEPTSVVQDLQTWLDQARGAGGRRPSSDAIRYSVLAALVALYALLISGRNVSWKLMLQVLLFEMSPEQRERLGMTADLTNTRAASIQKLAATTGTKKDSSSEYSREYGRFANFVNSICDVIDPSPYSKKDTGPRDSGTQPATDDKRRPTCKMTNAQRDDIRDNADHPKRRIGPQVQDRNQQRLERIANKIVAASAMGAPTDHWHGDLATDETILITLSSRYGHGTRPELLVSADPDAHYWPGKRGAATDAGDQPLAGRESPDDEERGHGYGITYVLRMGRPYCRAVPNVAIGIHVGRPTGGSAADVRVALEHATRHQLTGNHRKPLFAADMGFTTKDDWLPLMQQFNYATLQDYPSSWSIEKAVEDVDVHGNPVPGGYLVGGQIVCPGACGLQPPPKWDNRKGPEPVEVTIQRHQQMQLLDAMTMPSKSPLRTNKSNTGGRPKAAQESTTYSITTQCPAVLGTVNCSNAPLPDGQRLADRPDVPNPPSPHDPDGRPRACRQDHTSHRLTPQQAKRLQGLIHGSHLWDDYYSTMRSANERFHSALKNPHGSGVREDDWLQVRGRAKVTLALAIATAANNHNILEAFHSNQMDANGQPKFPPRETLRRTRQTLLKQHIK